MAKLTQQRRELQAQKKLFQRKEKQALWYHRKRTSSLQSRKTSHSIADRPSVYTYHSDCESDRSIKSPSSHSTLLLSDSESEPELTREQSSSPQPLSSPSSSSFSLSRSTSTSPLFVVPKTVLRERSPSTIGFSKKSNRVYRPKLQRSSRLPNRGLASMKKKKVEYEDDEDDLASQLPHRGMQNLMEQRRQEEWLNMPECTLPEWQEEESNLPEHSFPESPCVQQDLRRQQKKQLNMQPTTHKSLQTVE